MQSLLKLSEQPSVSVIIPTHNRREYLSAALQSAFAQTYKPLEIIVIDDASTDDTPALLAKLGTSIVWRRLELQSGPAAARNIGMALAQGDLFAFLDSDDEWDPSKLARQVTALVNARHPYGGIFCAMRHVSESGPVVLHPEQPSDPSVSLMCITNVPGSPSAVMIRREALERLGGFDPQLPPYEDWDFWLRIAVAYGWLGIRDRLVTYRRHEGQLSASWEKNFIGRSRFFEKHRKLIESEAPEKMQEWLTGLPRFALLAGNFVEAAQRQLELAETYPTFMNRAVLYAMRFSPRTLRAAASARRWIMLKL